MGTLLWDTVSFRRDIKPRSWLTVVINPLSIVSPFSWHKNDNIKWSLLLNPIDYRYNLGLIRKVTLWCLYKSQNYSKYYWNKVTEAQTQWNEKIFSLKWFSVFDWIHIVAVAGALRNTREPSHNTGQIPFLIWWQYHQQFASCIVFSNLFLGSFPKTTFGYCKRKHGNCSLKPPLSLCPKLLLLAAILRQQQFEKIIKNKHNNHNIINLYTNLFIEVHWLKFLSNTQPPSTSETHPIISHASYYWKSCCI